MKLILEQRYVFDGSGVATVHHALHHHHTPGAHAATDASPHEIIFVDPRVTDWQQLTASIPANAEVVVLDPTKDAIQQITQTLEGQHNVTAIDILSHGSAGTIEAGSTPITAATLATDSAEIASWSGHLAPGADISIYGCNVGAGPTGQALISELHTLTGAQVAASTDDTGAATLGGNWTLEATTGPITATDPFTSAAEAAYGYLLTGFPQANISVSGLGTNTPGSTVTEVVTFTNPGGQMGYNAYVDLFVPAALATGGITVSSPDVTIPAANIKTTTLAAGTGGTLTCTDPISGVALTVSAAEVTALGLAAGDTVEGVILTNNMAAGSAAIHLDATFTLPSTAATVATMLNASNVYYVGAAGGYEFGDSPTGTTIGNASSDGDNSQLGSQHIASGSYVALTSSDITALATHESLVTVTVGVATVDGESETATGHSFPVTYEVTVTPTSVISSTNPLSGVTISFTLPNTVTLDQQYDATNYITTSVGSGSASALTWSGGTGTNTGVNSALSVTFTPATMTVPSNDAANGDTFAPGGTVSIALSQITSSTADHVYVKAYVPQYDGNNAEILTTVSTSPNTTVGQSIDATKAISLTAQPSVSALTWHYNGTSPAAHVYDLASLALATPADSIDVSNTSFTARALAEQVSTSGSVTPGQTGVTITANFQVSDYYSVKTPVLTAVLADGLGYDAASVTYTINGGSGTTTASSTSASGTTGDTTVTFNLASIATILTPGTSNHVAFTAHVNDSYSVQHATSGHFLKENDYLTLQNAESTGSATGAPSGANSDAVFAQVVGDLYRQDTTTLLNGGGALDDSAATMHVPVGTVSVKVVDVGTTPVTDTGSAPYPQITAGENVTYEVTYTLVSGDYSALTLTALLPSPIFSVTNPTQGGASSFTINNSGTVTTGQPATGTVSIVGIGSLNGASLAAVSGGPAVPTILSVTPDGGTNGVTFNLGSLSDLSNTGGTIKIDFTVTASNQPFANGLLLNARAESSNNNSVATASTLDTSTTIQLSSPDLTIKKGVASFDGNDGITDKTLSGTYTIDGGSTSESATTVNTTFTQAGTTLAGNLTDIFTSGTPPSLTAISDVLNLNLAASGTSGASAGDTVRIVDTVVNTGRGDAYGVQIKDQLPTSTYLNTSAGTNGVVNFEIIRGDGTVLVDSHSNTIGSGVTTSGGGAIGSISALITDFFSSTGILLQNAGSSSLPVVAGTNNATGGNGILYVVYDMQLSTTLAPGTTVLANNAASQASLLAWTNTNGGSLNFAVDTNYPATEVSAGQTPYDLGQTVDGAKLTTATYTGELQIVGSSEATVATPLITTSNPLTGAPVGDIVRMRAYVEIPEGTNSLTYDIKLPQGMQYLGGATVGVAATTPGHIDLSASGISGVSVVSGDPTSVLDTAQTTTLSAGDIGSTNNGHTVTFTLGSVANNDHTATGTAYVMVDFDAVVVNTDATTAKAAAAGATLTPEFTLNSGTTFGSDGQANANTDTTDSFVQITVAEPDVSVDKTITSISGDTVTYEITLTNSNAGTSAIAYDVLLTDVLPSGVASSLVVSSSGFNSTPTFTAETSLGGAITSLGKGDTATVTYSVTFSSPAVAMAATTATVTWNSLQVPVGSEASYVEHYVTPGGSAVDGGDPGSATGSRDGADTGTNVYDSTSSIGLTAVTGTVWVEAPPLASNRTSGTDYVSNSSNTLLSGDTVTGTVGTFTTGPVTTVGGTYTLLMPSVETNQVEDGTATTVKPTIKVVDTHGNTGWYDTVGMGSSNITTTNVTNDTETVTMALVANTTQNIGFAYTGADTAPVISDNGSVNKWNTAIVTEVAGVAVALSSAPTVPTVPTVADAEIDVGFGTGLSYNGGVLTIQRQGGANTGDVFSAINGLTLSGGNVTLTGVNGGAVIGTYTNTAGALTITFSSTTVNSAAIATILGDVAYKWNGTTDLLQGPVTLQATLSDGNTSVSGGNFQGTGGSLTSVAATVVVDVQGTTSTKTFTEPNNISPATSPYPVALDAALTLDTASLTSAVNTASATVQITGNYLSGQDVLAFTNGTGMGNIAASWDATSGTLSLTSSGHSATLAQWQAALQAVTYYDTSDTPITTARTVTIQVSENAAVVAQENVTVNVVSVDDSPVLSDTRANPTTIAVTSLDVAPTGGHLPSDAVQVSTLINGLITDADGNGTGTQSPGIAITAADTTKGTWYFSTNAGTTWSTLPVGSLSTSTALLLDSTAYVYFAPTSATTYGSVAPALTFRAWDESSMTGSGATAASFNGTVKSIGGSGWGGGSNTLASSFSAVADTVTLTIEAPPQVVTSAGSATFTEPNNAPGGGTTADPAAAVAVDPGITVADFLPNGTATTLSSATVQVTGNYQSGEDVLAFTNTADIHGSYSNGTLTLSAVSGTPTLAEWQTALRSVTYYDSSDTPNTGARTVTFTVHDSSGTLNDSTTATSTPTRTVNVVSVDDSPVLTNETPTIAVSSLGAAPSNGSIPSGAELLSTLIGSPVTDADGNGLGVQSPGIAITAADTSKGNWYVSTNGGATWSEFAGTGITAPSVHNALELLPNANTYVYFQPTSTAWGGTVTGALTFRAWDGSSLTGANFANGSSHDIDPGNNTALFGTGTSNAMEQSFSAVADTVTLTIEAPPQVVTSAGTATFTEPNNVPGGGTTADPAAAVVVDPGITVANLDPTVTTPTLVSATVQVTGNYQSGEDVLAFTNTADIHGSYSNGTLTLSAVSGTPTLAEWQTALRSVTYYDTSDVPNTGARTVTFTVHDSSGTLNDSTTATSTPTRTVNVVSVDDSPVLNTTVPVQLTSELVSTSAPVGVTGTLVNTLVGANLNVTDADGNGLGVQTPGLAITQVDTSKGAWWYTTNNGVTWTLFAATGSSTISNANALLLQPDANTRVYFQATTGFTGTIDAALTFRAWDASPLTGTPTANGVLASVGASGWGSGVNVPAASVSAAYDVVPLDIRALPVQLLPPVLPPAPPPAPPPPAVDPAPVTKPVVLFTPPPETPAGSIATTVASDQSTHNALGLDMTSPMAKPESLDLMLVASVGNRFVVPEQPATIEVPPSVFRSSNPGEPLAYEAVRPDGSPLPKWLSFDARNLTFRGVPPDSARGAVDIVIVAKDTHGNKAEAEFKILVGRDAGNDAPVQNGTKAAPAKQPPAPAGKRSDAGFAAPEHHAALTHDGNWFASLTAPSEAHRHVGFAAQVQQMSAAGRAAKARALLDMLAG